MIGATYLKKTESYRSTKANRGLFFSRMNRIIQEVIKGSWSSDSIYIPAYVSGRVVTDDYGRQYSQYILPDVRDPEYQEDEVYLLCLTCKDELQVYTGYGRTVSAVVLDEGYLYPRYNTEYHPFAGVSLDQVKNYCRQ